MPHDSTGRELKVGDRVTLEFEVKSIAPTEDACNVTLETVATLAAIQGGETYSPQLTLNSRFATLKSESDLQRLCSGLNLIEVKEWGRRVEPEVGERVVSAIDHLTMEHWFTAQPGDRIPSNSHRRGVYLGSGIVRLLTLLLLILALAAPTLAGDCNVLYRQRVVYAAPVQAVIAQHYAPGYLQYAVGSDIQVEAVAEKIAQKLAPKLQAMLAAPRTDAGTLSVRTPAVATVLSAKCARCHSGTEPKAGLLLDGSVPVDDATFRSIVRMLGKGEGIPKAMTGVVAGLQPADKGLLTEELLGLEAPHDAPPPPAPEPGVLK